MRRTAAFLSLLFVLSLGSFAEGPSLAPASGDPPAEATADYGPLLGRMVTVKTVGGGSFRGILFSAAGDRIELASPEGLITGIARSSILSLEAIDEGRDQVEYFQDSAANRLIVMPTAFGMEPGELHVAAQEIVAITASYGISRNLSAWGGVSFPGGLVNLRWSAATGDRSALSLGALGCFLWMSDSGLLLPYAIFSWGHENRNLTLGAGVPAAWWPGAGIHFSGAVATVAGKVIVSPTTSVVTENWLVAVSDDWSWSGFECYAFPAAVFRIAGERFSWDIGAVLPLIIGGEPFLRGIADGYIIPIPILSVTYRIN